MQTTRWEILQLLKEKGQCTVEEFAREIKLAPISVRYHLNSLEGENLVKANQVRRQIGRPHYAYTLTNKAQDLFPEKYHILIDMLLAGFKNILGEEQVSELLRSIAREIASKYEKQLEGKSLEKKLELMVQLLGEEGYTISWVKSGKDYIVQEHVCPFYQVSKKHPEVCQIDLKLLQALLKTNVKRKSCILKGDNTCTYKVVMTRTAKETA